MDSKWMPERADGEKKNGDDVSRRRVFLSAVSSEFGSYRELLERDLRRADKSTYRVDVKTQDSWGTLGGTTLGKLDEFIKGCNAVVHLIGDSIGSTPPQTSVTELILKHPDLLEKVSVLKDLSEEELASISYTQWEAYLALYHHKRLHIYLAAPEAPRDPGFESDLTQEMRQGQHYKRIGDMDCDRGQFASQERLSSFVLADLNDILPSGPPVSHRHLDEAGYLEQLKADILKFSDPPWHPALYTELHGERRHSTRPAFLETLVKVTTGGRTRKIENLLTELRSVSHPIVITGAPGSGKSVLLRQLALALIDDSSANPEGRFLPLLVELKFYREEVSAVDFLREVLKARAYTADVAANLDILLARGRLVLLLDGMDEMRAHEYSARLHKLKELTRQFPANRFIFTCRERDYDPSFAVEQWTIQELSESQIEDFIERSCTFEKQPYPNALRTAELKRTRPDLLDAARNPFMLRLLLTYVIQRDQLPAHIRELYECFIEYLVKKHGSDKAAVEHCFQVLAQIGLAVTNQEGLGVEIRMNDLRLSEGDELACQIGIESGVLNHHIGPDTIHFSHHRLQEYFAARAIDAEFSHNPHVLSRYVDNVWAEEIISTLVSVSVRPNDILRALLSADQTDFSKAQARRILIAARCIAVARSAVSPELVMSAIRRLNTLVEYADVPYRVKALRALSRLSPEDALPILCKHGAEDSSLWVRNTCAVCHDEITSHNPQLRSGQYGKMPRKIIPVDVRASREEWEPLRFMFGILAILILLVGTLSLVLTEWSLTEWSDVMGPTTGAFVAYYVLALFCWSRLRYEWSLSKRAWFSPILAARVVGMIATALLTAVTGLVLLRPLPFLVVTMATLFSLFLSERFVLTHRLKQHNPQWISLLHFLPCLGLSLIYAATGISGVEEFYLLNLFMSSHWFFLVLIITIVWGLDYVTLRWLSSLKLAGPIAMRSLRVITAFARTESKSSLAFFHSMIATIRRHAIRSLGHQRYHAEVMNTLVEIVEEDASSYLRDAAWQAIDEVQQRQRRDGQTEGLNVSPRYPLFGDVGMERRFLFVIIAVMLVSSMTHFASTAAFLNVFVHESRCFLNGFVLSRLGLERAARDTFESCPEGGAKSANTLNALAWLLATSNNPQVRDPNKAISYAQEAVAMTKESNTNTLDTLAEAYYQAGMEDKAIQTIDRGLHLNPKDRYIKIRRHQFLRRLDTRP